MTNLPRKQLLDEAEVTKLSYLLKGIEVIIYFKFTCHRCGERCTLNEPDTLHERGECCICGAETTINEGGFMLIIKGKEHNE